MLRDRTSPHGWGFAFCREMSVVACPPNTPRMVPRALRPLRASSGAAFTDVRKSHAPPGQCNSRRSLRVADHSDGASQNAFGGNVRVGDISGAKPSVAASYFPLEARPGLPNKSRQAQALTIATTIFSVAGPKKKTLNTKPNCDLPEEEVVEDLDPAEEIIPYTYTITSYGADYPVDSLVKRITAHDILVPVFSWKNPIKSNVVGFQREYVWPRPKADRFIESLLLGLPVPGIFLVKEPSGVLLVLDGHQRLHTLSSFYSGAINDDVYRLGEVQERFAGKRYADLDIEDRRRLDDSIIHATVVRQDEPTEDQSSIYVIFERLNTGGVNLQPQEIRVALYHGEFVRILQELNDDSNWRKLYGVKSKRLKDMELILRFFAFLFYAHRYESPMKGFLNRYMATNRQLAKQSGEELRSVFTNTTKTILSALGSKAFRPRRAINAAVVDSIMVGVAKRLISGRPIKNLKGAKERFDKLLADPDYFSAVETGTSQEANVKTRLKKAEAAFANVL